MIESVKGNDILEMQVHRNDFSKGHLLPGIPASIRPYIATAKMIRSNHGLLIFENYVMI
jgi:hypothetical protein